MSTSGQVNYTHNLLSNQGQIDRGLSGVRTLFFMKYQGAKLKTVVVNL
jgi:hypothetical protein